jgi:hypothetical protein
MLIQEIAALSAELDDRKRFLSESSRESLKVASRVRLFLANRRGSKIQTSSRKMGK